MYFTKEALDNTVLLLRPWYFQPSTDMGYQNIENKKTEHTTCDHQKSGIEIHPATSIDHPQITSELDRQG